MAKYDKELGCYVSIVMCRHCDLAFMYSGKNAKQADEERERALEHPLGADVECERPGQKHEFEVVEHWTDAHG